MQAKNSGKVNLIDFSTFEKIQKNSDGNEQSMRHIRNSKYRKKHRSELNHFNLVAWIGKSHRKKTHTHYKKGATLLSVKKVGKISENRQKKLTRLKKTIIQHRSKNKQTPRNSEVIENGKFALDNETQENPIETTLQDAVLNTSDLQQLSTVIEEELKDLSLNDPKQSVHKTIHSRRFREYCDNCTTIELKQLTKDLLGSLNHFQRRAYAKNPIKANAHRRFVIGFREVQNLLEVNKIKLVLMASDCEKCTTAGGIDEIIETIKSKCNSMQVPYAFTLDRRQMAYALQKKGIVSCIGILDYDGARETFIQFQLALQTARQKYILATET